jgi:hypothetical protein
MYELGRECGNSGERTCWLSKAAGEGYVPAMYAFAMECLDINTLPYAALCVQCASQREEGHRPQAK